MKRVAAAAKTRMSISGLLNWLRKIKRAGDFRSFSMMFGPQRVSRLSASSPDKPFSVCVSKMPITSGADREKNGSFSIVFLSISILERSSDQSDKYYADKIKYKRNGHKPAHFHSGEPEKAYTQFIRKGGGDNQTAQKKRKPSEVPKF